MHCVAESVTLCKGKIPRRKNVITHFPQSNETLRHFLKSPKTQVSPSYARGETASHLNQARRAGDTAYSHVYPLQGGCKSAFLHPITPGQFCDHNILEISMDFI